ncbi:hypothetical protein MBT84_43085 [Streptomyces sp. MBT84]|nr:hypothetical protein [Streptomyces sp. MBT84]
MWSCDTYQSPRFPSFIHTTGPHLLAAQEKAS